MSQNVSRRAKLLFIHAHPDDETLATGVTMAAYAAGGHDVHLLTCTLGEEGEIIPPALAHLGADRDDTLGPWRREELRSAMSVLGVAHAVLGEDSESAVGSRYRDSGMAGTPSAAHPDAFVRADPLEAATLVAAHIKAVRPDVVVTYDEHGGYAHPDHIQTHRVTMAALVLLAAEAEAGRLVVPMAFCILTPLSWATQDRAWLHKNVAATNPNCLVLQPDAPYPPSVVNDSVVTHLVEEPAMVDIQSRALSRHATQVRVHDGYYSLSNRVAGRLGGREGFAQFDPVGGELLPATHDALRHSGLLTDSRVRR
ncbi:MAG: N-acetyl-1-D-myo-inositol-2-amino-2-deoxy-alpha-D-glucopyranoside deacetylase [Dermatophilaceae bacterium]